MDICYVHIYISLVILTKRYLSIYLSTCEHLHIKNYCKEEGKEKMCTYLHI